MTGVQTCALPISDVVRKTLLTYWNTVSFFTLYASAANFVLPEDRKPSSVTMDRWIVSELNTLILLVDAAFENFDSQEVGRLLATFIDDLSNWYVRRSRRRFWEGEVDALTTLYTCLKALTQLMSPMVPFITEHVWQTLVRSGESASVESVHLSLFPVADESQVDVKLSSSVALSRRLVELGRAARAESKMKIRQPLARALVAANGWSAMDLEIRIHVQDELNVLKIDLLSDEDEGLVNISIKANFRSIGARYGADVQAIASTILQADASALVYTLRQSGSYTLAYGEKSAELIAEDFVITEIPKTGWSVATHAGESVALDLKLTPALFQAGLMREVIRTIQELRKSSGFDISDRIHIRWNADADVASAITTYLDQISEEVLALSITQDRGISSRENEIGLGLLLNRG